MASLEALMESVRGLRDALHDRMDDNVSNRVFAELRLRHTQAVIQARREVEGDAMSDPSDDYDGAIDALGAATGAVEAAEATDEGEMLSALRRAGQALDRVGSLH